MKFEYHGQNTMTIHGTDIVVGVVKEYNHLFGAEGCGFPSTRVSQLSALSKSVEEITYFIKAPLEDQDRMLHQDTAFVMDMKKDNQVGIHTLFIPIKH